MKHEAKPVRHKEAFSPTALLALLVLLLVACRLLTSVPGEIETQTVSSTLEPTFTPPPPPTYTPQRSPTATPTKPTATATPTEPTSTPTPQPCLSGRILDQATGQPIVGAKVSAGTYTTTTDADGRYTVTGLPPGQYVLSVTHDDYDPGLSSIFTLAAGQGLSLDLTLYTPGTSPYPEDPMRTNPLDPNGAPTAEDAERLARSQGLTGEIVSIQETKLSGPFLVNYKIGDEVRAAVTEVRHEAWALTDDTGQKWWIIKGCGNLASRPGEGVIIPTPEPHPLPPVGKIAFLSDRDGNNAIYVMNADGNDQTHLIKNPDSEWQPAWSPDGQQIAFVSHRNGNPDIYLMNVDGSDQTRLTNSPGYDGFLAWSSDSRQIAFTSSRDGNNEIYVMNADGSNQTRLTNNSANDFKPAWSPNGRRIAFYSNRDEPDPDNCGRGGKPTCNWEIYVMNADGSDQTRLTNNLAHDSHPVWSPDGRQIAFVSDRDGNLEIYVMNADGSDQTRLTNNSANDGYPTWSPDGRQIAFVSDRDGNLEIYVMNIDGSDQTCLTNHPANDRAPVWLH